MPPTNPQVIWAIGPNIAINIAIMLPLLTGEG